VTSGPAARWLVTGAGGMLGVDLAAAVTAAGHEVTAATRRELDVTDESAVRAAVPGHRVVVNAAAFTDVDGAEALPDRAMAVNGLAAGHLALACAAAGAVLLQVSTDYVLAGDAAAPYSEDAPVAPVNVYGRSKLAGERAVLEALPGAGYVVRTAWLYGEHGRSFVGTMLRLARERETVDVVDDARGQPTWTCALAARLVALGEAALTGRAAPGVYHATSAGEATWYDLARAVFALGGHDAARVRPTTSAEFRRPAPRPAYSVLGHARWASAGLAPMAQWREMLAEAMRRPGFRALAATA
jgi:dTDP-4-dehydrorhamnose reductase